MNNKKNAYDEAGNTAVSSDGKFLAVRNRHSIELLDAASGTKVGDSGIEDATPNAISTSLVSIVFSPEGSQLFYVRASYVESELFSFSLPALSIDKRVKVGPIPSAIAIVPGRHWLLVATGSPGKAMLEAFNMKTLATELEASLAADTHIKAISQHHVCTKTFHSG